MQNRRNFLKNSFLSLSCIPILGVMFKPKVDNIESDNSIQKYQEECFSRGIYPEYVTIDEFRKILGIR